MHIPYRKTTKIKNLSDANEAIRQEEENKKRRLAAAYSQPVSQEPISVLDYPYQEKPNTTALNNQPQTKILKPRLQNNNHINNTEHPTYSKTCEYSLAAALFPLYITNELIKSFQDIYDGRIALGLSTSIAIVSFVAPVIALFVCFALHSSLPVFAPSLLVGLGALSWAISVSATMASCIKRGLPQDSSKSQRSAFNMLKNEKKALGITLFFTEARRQEIKILNRMQAQCNNASPIVTKP